MVTRLTTQWRRGDTKFNDNAKRVLPPATVRSLLRARSPDACAAIENFACKRKRREDRLSARPQSSRQ